MAAPLTLEFDRWMNFRALRAAALRAARGHRDSPDACAFLLDLERECLWLEARLRRGGWRPGLARTFEIRDPKRRRITAVPFRDRVVHHALIDALLPDLEAASIGDSYACRRGRGLHAAVRRLQHLTRLSPRFLGLDVRHCFETLPHAAVLEALPPADAATLRVVADILAVGATEPRRGLAIGALTSQHFANHTLGALDRAAIGVLGPGRWVRYMDDMRAFGERDALYEVERVVGETCRQLGIEIKAERTLRGPVSIGVPFLGFRVWPRLIRFDGARRRRFLLRIRRDHPRAGAGDPVAIQSVASVLAWSGLLSGSGLRRAAVFGVASRRQAR